MNKITLLLILIINLVCFSEKNNAQVLNIPIITDTLSTESQGIETIDYILIDPNFQWGDSNLWCILENRLNFDILNNPQLYGSISVSFNIDSNGYIKIAEIDNFFLKSVDTTNTIYINLISEIKRVIKSIPPNKQAYTEIKLSNDINKFVLVFNFPYYDFHCSDIVSLQKNETIFFFRDIDIKADCRYGDEKNAETSIYKYINSKPEILKNIYDCTNLLFIRFKIAKNGDILDVERLKDYGVDCNTAFNPILQNLITMPHWQPAMINNKPVKSYYPFIIKIIYK